MQSIILFGGPLCGTQMRVSDKEIALFVARPDDDTKSNALYKRTESKDGNLIRFAYVGTEQILMSPA